MLSDISTAELNSDSIQRAAMHGTTVTANQTKTCNNSSKCGSRKSQGSYTITEAWQNALQFVDAIHDDTISKSVTSNEFGTLYNKDTIVVQLGSTRKFIYDRVKYSAEAVKASESLTTIIKVLK